MNKINKSKVALGILSVVMSTSVLATTEMHELTDAELSEQTGQALLSLGYTNPSATGEGKNTSDYGFYKLGLEAKVELNAFEIFNLSFTKSRSVLLLYPQKNITGLSSITSLFSFDHLRICEFFSNFFFITGWSLFTPLIYQSFIFLSLLFEPLMYMKVKLVS